MKAEIKPSKLTNIKRGNFEIIVLPDLHIPIDMELKEIILNSELLKKIDFVVLLGDNVACYGNEFEYSKLNEFIKKLAKPYTAINGNHEIMFKVFEYGDKNYGKIWERNNEEGRKKQIEKFYNFFEIKSPYWKEILNYNAFLFFTIGNYKEEKIEILPENGENFLINTLKEFSDFKNIIVFCHAPLNGSQIDGFKYYDENGDPFIYLSRETLKIIENFKGKIYWISGHIHLLPSHPMFSLRKIKENLIQINCPPGWKWGRKKLTDVVPKRYDEFYTLILKIENEKIEFKIYDWEKRIFKILY